MPGSPDMQKMLNDQEEKAEQRPAFPPPLEYGLRKVVIAVEQHPTIKTLREKIATLIDSAGELQIPPAEDKKYWQEVFVERVSAEYLDRLADLQRKGFSKAAIKPIVEKVKEVLGEEVAHWENYIALYTPANKKAKAKKNLQQKKYNIFVEKRNQYLSSLRKGLACFLYPEHGEMLNHRLDACTALIAKTFKDTEEVLTVEEQTALQEFCTREGFSLEFSSKEFDVLQAVCTVRHPNRNAYMLIKQVFPDRPLIGCIEWVEDVEGDVPHTANFAALVLAQQSPVFAPALALAGLSLNPERNENDFPQLPPQRYPGMKT